MTIRRFVRSWTPRVAFVVYVGLLGHGLHTGSHAQQPAARSAAVAAAAREFKYYGASSCSGCHSEPRGLKSDFVLLTEYTTWKERDKHSQAYRVLLEPRSQQMGKLLGIANVAEDARCLNCHATNVPANLREPSFQISDGVSCDACHGPAEKWFAQHIQPTWRAKPMAEKEALGMSDIRDPVKRSQLCMSCHVGNVAEGKLVTHAMYAAGHPPLPSFEVATYSDEMPRHWRYIHEKDPAIRQKVYREVLRLNPDELERAKLAAVGGAVALRVAANLLREQAQGEGGDRPWPELANYDCYACHHDLRAQSWRQERGYSGRPGRPPVREWPTVLARADARGMAGGAPALDRSLRALGSALDTRPFGRPADVARTASEVADRSEQLVQKLNAASFDQAAALRLLRDLAALGAGPFLDYDSARQVAWAFRIIYQELEPKPAGDAQIRQALQGLDAELGLTLPSGTKTSISQQLEGWLQKVNAYRPQRVRELLGQIAAALPR